MVSLHGLAFRMYALTCFGPHSATALSISFKEPDYTVLEVVGMFTVCVELNIISSEDITVTLDDVQDSASPGNVLPS